MRRQCELAGLARSSCYYELAPERPENLKLMRLMDEQYLETPFFGSRRMRHWLMHQGYAINRKRVQRLMRVMGLEAIYPKPRTTRRQHEHPAYPYLLRGLEITHPDQVWCADITYVPLQLGFGYLVAIMDWYSRYVLSWRLSNSLEGSFCTDALAEALSRSRPEIFNTDQGSQFTSDAFTGRLQEAGIAISMDGRGRALDNVFIERLWWSVKHENIYLLDYADLWEAEPGLGKYFGFYNEERNHQALDYETPAQRYACRGRVCRRKGTGGPRVLAN